MCNAKVTDPIPNNFETETDAGEFWDSHSASDYREFLEPSNDHIAIENRIFEVRISEDLFKKLRKQAESTHQSLPKTVDKILRKELSPA